MPRCSTCLIALGIERVVSIKWITRRHAPRTLSMESTQMTAKMNIQRKTIPIEEPCVLFCGKDGKPGKSQKHLSQKVARRSEFAVISYTLIVFVELAVQNEKDVDLKVNITFGTSVNNNLPPFKIHAHEKNLDVDVLNVLSTGNNGTIELLYMQVSRRV
ncbi:hypothetical protein L1987_68932 [Smallanthus sonchifolius]|uniref:Uncharacterized protein n=1 Tax=Smallanthus sonchifolius TaxID=185202 RepID=A0ACB9B5Z8_9ASTR|nr:hypothetical protein L1987_68932 [Smallanthus sonchifolius]